MKSLRWLAIGMTVISLSLTGCGGGGGENNPSGTTDLLTGTYEVQWSGMGPGAEPDHWTFSQSGSDISATFSDDLSDQFLSGTLGGNALSFTVTGAQFSGTYANGSFSAQTTINGQTYGVTGQKDSNFQATEINIPSRTITVDGSPGDWAGISPVITDRTSDVSTVSGCDIKDVYVAEDSQNFYALITTANGAPADNLYIGFDVYPHPGQKAGDRFIFINFPDSVSVESRNQDTSGYHTFVAVGTLAVNGSTIELSVPLSALNPATKSYLTVHDDADINNVETNLDETARVTLDFPEGPTYSTSDLNGTWSEHQLSAADSPVWFGWSYSDVTFDNGTATASNNYESPGVAAPSNSLSNFSVSPEGIVTNPAYDIHGVLSQNKNIIVGTYTDDSAPALGFFIKRESTVFSSSDPVGTWDFNALEVGDKASANWWGYGEATISSAGTVSLSGTISDGSNFNSSSDFVIASDGTITSNSNPTIDGFMNADKNLMVLSYSDYNGTGNPGIMIFVKAGASFTQADLVGTWSWHALRAQDSSNFWAYGDMNIDASGNTTMSPATFSDGTSATPTVEGPLVLASDGTISAAGDHTLHGVLDRDEGLMVWTVTSNNSSGAGPSLWIGLKR